MQMHDQTYKDLPPISGPRALLKARMAELTSTEGHGGWFRSTLGVDTRRLAHICALALIASMIIRVAISKVAGRTEIVSAQHAGELPNPSLTPGMTRKIAISDICSMDHDEVVRPVPAALGQKILDEYGIPHAPIENYEIDYLITPGLGGADDIRNLWPEPKYNAEWNSFAKDQLEDRLHQLVCSRKLRLSTAQTEVAKDWISAYKKYFDTNAPLPASAIPNHPPALATLLPSDLILQSSFLEVKSR